jgi:hypothetical protein
MKPIVCALILLVSTVIRSRVSLQLEIVALRHQLAVPSARRLALETVFSGRGSRAAGRVAGRSVFCPDRDGDCLAV